MLCLVLPLALGVWVGGWVEGEKGGEEWRRGVEGRGNGGGGGGGRRAYASFGRDLASIMAVWLDPSFRLMAGYG